MIEEQSVNNRRRRKILRDGTLQQGHGKGLTARSTFVHDNFSEQHRLRHEFRLFEGIQRSLLHGFHGRKYSENLLLPRGFNQRAALNRYRFSRARVMFAPCT
jgi:hypothetical protein